MSEAEIVKGCTEYFITCSRCGRETVTHEFSKACAVDTFRKDGWSIGLRGNNFCDDCSQDKKGD